MQHRYISFRKSGDSHESGFEALPSGYCISNGIWHHRGIVLYPTIIGNQLLAQFSLNQHFAFKAPSAVLPKEFNFILNPSYPF
jgi:hypothetical protein